MIDLKDCSAEAMSVALAVNFMYGFSIPGIYIYLHHLYISEYLRHLEA